MKNLRICYIAMYTTYLKAQVIYMYSNIKKSWNNLYDIFCIHIIYKFKISRRDCEKCTKFRKC